jgi:hypothetical protein
MRDAIEALGWPTWANVIALIGLLGAAIAAAARAIRWLVERRDAKAKADQDRIAAEAEAERNRIAAEAEARATTQDAITQVRTWVRQTANENGPPESAVARVRSRENGMVSQLLTHLVDLRSRSLAERSTHEWANEYARTRKEFEEAMIHFQTELDRNGRPS